MMASTFGHSSVVGTLGYCTLKGFQRYWCTDLLVSSVPYNQLDLGRVDHNRNTALHLACLQVMCFTGSVYMYIMNMIAHV